jgi:soluble cytochrome b562
VEQPAASPVVSPAAGGDLSALTAVVTKTRAAVEAGDEAKAKTEFEQFEAAWKPVEDGIKEKNPKAYEAIEEAMDGVSGQLSGNLDKAKALAALSSLEGAIGQAK